MFGAPFCNKLSDQIEDIQVNFLSPKILQETSRSNPRFSWYVCLMRHFFNKLSDQIEDIQVNFLSPRILQETSRSIPSFSTEQLLFDCTSTQNIGAAKYVPRLTILFDPGEKKITKCVS